MIFENLTITTTDFSKQKPLYYITTLENAEHILKTGYLKIEQNSHPLFTSELSSIDQKNNTIIKIIPNYPELETLPHHQINQILFFEQPISIPLKQIERIPLRQEEIFIFQILENQITITSDIDCDFNLEMSRNKNYQKMIQENNQIDLKQLQTHCNHTSFLKHFKEKIITLKKEVLFQSPIHGKNHNIRVLLYSMLIENTKNLTPDLKKIIEDAALYHDIGRHNDLTDPLHGKRSAEKIEEIIKEEEFYQNKNYLNLLKASIEIHSLRDHQEQKIIKKYQIKEEKEFKMIYQILKDADALDRVRACNTLPYQTDLNPTFLRLETSKTLVKLSHQLYYLYRNSSN